MAQTALFWAGVIGGTSVAWVSAISWYSLQTVNVGLIGFASLLAGPVLVTYAITTRKSLKLFHLSVALSSLAAIFLLLNVLLYSTSGDPERLEHPTLGRPTGTAHRSALKRPAYHLLPPSTKHYLEMTTAGAATVGVLAFLIATVFVLRTNPPLGGMNL